MDDPIQDISLARLAFGFIGPVIVVALMAWWSVRPWTAVHALGRMLLQLLIIGYLLVYILGTPHLGVVMAVFAVMLISAAAIALRPVEGAGSRHYLSALLAIAVAAGLSLFTATVLVLQLEPWYAPRYAVPLAGMIFASAMNAVSLAAERAASERASGMRGPQLRSAAFSASLIPVVNSLFAVGLVSLPGMMTGQIVSGTSPLVAVRYQVLVMCVLFGAAGIAAALYLVLSRGSARQAG